MLLACILTSCASSKKEVIKESELAGYTLKNKVERMQQQIAHKKCKTVLSTP